MKLDHLGMGLLVAGLALAFIADKPAATVALFMLGASLFAFHELLPHMEGRFEIGPKGLAATLRASRISEVSAKAPSASSEVAVIQVPAIRIASAAKVAEVSAIGNGGFVPVPLMEGDTLTLTTRYRTPQGQEFQIAIPVSFIEKNA